MGLRKGQKELVEEYRGGHCAIAAIPGGGKTHCLSIWASNTILSGLHKPGKILIVTYMNSAVNNFKQRISIELLKNGYQGNRDYFVSTIHGLCMQIIKEKPDIININDEFGIIDGVTKAHLINNCLDEWKRHNFDKFKLYIDESNLNSNKIQTTYKTWQDKLCSNILFSIISDFKSRGIPPEQAIEKIESLDSDSILQLAAQIYIIYNRKLKIMGLLDFDDMLFNAKKMLLEDPHLLNEFREKYTFVCEDEAQDSNLIQSEILTLIANGNLLRVGDSNQAICGSFANSDFKLFRDFCEKDDTKVYKITQSSRNTRNIIDLANYFVKYIRDNHQIDTCKDSLLPQFIEPVDEDDDYKNPVIKGYGIDAQIFNSWEEEAYEIAKKASKILNDSQYVNKTISILIPSSWKINFLLNILDSNKTPYEHLDNTSAEKNKTLKILGRIIDFISCPQDGQKFANMLNDCFLKGDYNRELLISFIISYASEKILYPMSGEIDLNDIPRELLGSEAWKEMMSHLDLIRQLLEFPETAVEKLILYISEKLNFGVEERAIAQKVASDIRLLMSMKPRWSLSDLATELLSTKNMFNYFAGIVWDLKGYQPKPGIITVSTYHKSKGLEWDIVFLAGIDHSEFPTNLNDKFMGEYWFLKEKYKNPQAIAKAELEIISGNNLIDNPITNSKIETISERTRLLYVGITRAKEYLFLSGYHANKGKRNEILPSKYLIELKRYIEEKNQQ